MITIPHTKNYANLTDDERNEIVRQYNYAVKMGATDAGHAAAIAATNAFNLTTRQWNCNIGTNCYAMAVAVLFHNGIIKAQPIR